MVGFAVALLNVALGVLEEKQKLSQKLEKARFACSSSLFAEASLVGVVMRPDASLPRREVAGKQMAGVAVSLLLVRLSPRWLVAVCCLQAAFDNRLPSPQQQ